MTQEVEPARAPGSRVVAVSLLKKKNGEEVSGHGDFFSSALVNWNVNIQFHLLFLGRVSFSSLSTAVKPGAE